MQALIEKGILMRISRQIVVAAGLAVWMTLAAGCGEETSERWNEPLDVTSPVLLGDRIAYAERTQNRLFVVDPRRSGQDVELDIQDVPLGQEPGVVEASADGSQLYVVDEGDESLRIYDADSPEDPQVVELQAAYDRIAVDPEGEFVVLSFSGLGEDNIVARNLNEVGIVDLRTDPPQTYFVTLSTRANSFVFAPPFSLDGEPQRMMAVLANNEITVFDLLADNDEDRLREIPLTTSEAQRQRIPRQALFDLSREDEVNLYVRSVDLNDVSRVTIRMAAEGANRKLSLSTDVLTLGTPSRIALVDVPQGTRLVALSQVRPEMTIVDVVSNVSATFELPSNAPAADLLVYNTVVEENGEPREESRVLAYSPSSEIVSVIRPETISIDGEEPTLGRSVEAIRLEQRPERIELSSVKSDQAIVYHPGANAGFSLLNLAKNNDVPIQGGGLREVIFDGTFAYAIFQTLPNITIFATDGHPTNFDLPEVGSHVALDEDEGLIVVQHASQTGDFTILDANDPRPQNARFYPNVFIRDLFAQEL